MIISGVDTNNFKCVSIPLVHFYNLSLLARFHEGDQPLPALFVHLVAFQPHPREPSVLLDHLGLLNHLGTSVHWPPFPSFPGQIKLNSSSNIASRLLVVCLLDSGTWANLIGARLCRTKGVEQLNPGEPDWRSIFREKMDSVNGIYEEATGNVKKGVLKL